jgi:hypothetical protein
MKMRSYTWNMRTEVKRVEMEILNDSLDDGLSFTSR